MYDLVYQNDDFLIINKYSGIDFHGEEGILSRLRQDFSCYGVHRLDKPTSGLMIFAKNKDTQVILSELFSSRKIQKYYFAISDQRPSKKQGTIKGDLKKGRGGSYYLTSEQNNPTVTKFSSGFEESENLRLFIVKPFTGKTHQIRAVLKSIGSPILGDERYNGSIADRMYLHSYRIEFVFKNENFIFDCYPEKSGMFSSKNIQQKFSEMLSQFTY